VWFGKATSCTELRVVERKSIYKAFDPWPNPGEATVTISVGNSAPVARDSFHSVVMDDLLRIESDQLANDPDEDFLTFQIVSNATNGLLSFNANGPISYLPRPGFVGLDSFSYFVSDGKLVSDVQTVTIDVRSPVPYGWGTTVSTRRDEPLTILHSSLLKTASDGYAAGVLPLTATSFGEGSNGNLFTLPDGSFQFVPDQGFIGNASFKFQLFNGHEYSGAIEWTVRVGSHATDDVFSSRKGTVVGNVTSNDLGYFGPGYSIQLVQGPTQFVLNSDGSFSFTREPNFSGYDYFTYVFVRESTGMPESNIATATLVFHPYGDVAPVLPDSQFHVQSNGSVAGRIDGFDQDYDLLTYEFSNNANLLGHSDGTFSYQATTSFLGLDSALVRAFDGSKYSAWSSIIFEVSNEEPMAASRAIEIHWSKTLSIDLKDFAVDSDRDPLSFSILAAPSQGALVHIGGTQYTFRAHAGFLGAESLIYRVSDGQEHNTGTITINVTNSAPKTNWKHTNEAAGPDEYWITGTGALDVGFTSSPAARVVKGPQAGRVIRLNELVHFGEVDLAGYIGMGSPAQRAELSRRFGKVSKRIPLLDNDYDADGDKLRAELVRSVNSGTFQLSDDGSFFYQPDGQSAGIQSFVYRVYDGIEWSQPATVLIHVQNEPPVSQGFSIETGRLGSFGQKSADSAFAIPGNTTDEEHAKLTYSLVTPPTKGTAIVNPDGSYSYTNTDGVVGTDSFAYRSFDGVHYSQPARVSVTIKNESPVAKNDRYEAVRDFREGGLFDAVYSVIGSLPADDPEDDSLSLDFQSGPYHGTFALDNNGQFVYTPNAGFIGQDDVVYRVTDGLKTSNYAQLKFDVKQTAPDAVDDVFSMSGFAGEILNVGSSESVLRNDTDNENQALSATLWQAPATGKGIVSLQPDGSFQFDPEGYVGETEFSYVVSDGVTKSLPAKVKINVGSAKFSSSTTPIVIDLDQRFEGLIASFQLLNGVQISSNSTATIRWQNGSKVTSGTIGPTGLPAEQPQWGIVPVNLVFTTSGKQSVSIQIVDNQGRKSSAIVEFLVKAAPPKIVPSVTSLPAGLATNMILATFIDSRNEAPTSYDARIDWGDGVESNGLVERTSPGQYRVIGNHPYQGVGNKTVRIDLSTRDGFLSSASAVVSVDSQLLLEVTDFSHSGIIGVSPATKLASFKSNAPADLVSQLIPLIYWGDGTQSPGVVISSNNDEFEIRAGTSAYKSGVASQMVIAFADPAGVLESHTSNPANPSVLWFAQKTNVLTFESSNKASLVRFYGNRRGNPNAHFATSINWNDSRGTVQRESLNSSENWYQVKEIVGYSTVGSYQPNIIIRLMDGSNTVSATVVSPTISVASIAFIPMQRIISYDTTVARFTSSNPALGATDFVAKVAWSDGVVTQATIVQNGATFDVVSFREFELTSAAITSKTQINSAAAVSTTVPFGSGGSGQGEGEGEQSSGDGSYSQIVVASEESFIPIEDVSTGLSCPNMFRLFIDDENYEIDSQDDDKDSKKVRQDTSGRTGKIIVVNDSDLNNNQIIDKDENTSDVAQLVGHITPMSVSFQNDCESGCSPQSISLSWDTSALRVWSSVSGSYSILSPGSLSSSSLGVPDSGGSATLYVEGLKGSQTVGDQSMRGSWNGLSAEVMWTISSGIDIDVDSNNSGPFDHPSTDSVENEEEERNEDKKDDEYNPGKILLVNNDDGDLDDVVDYADGFGKSGTSKVNTEERFVPITIELPKLWELSELKLTLQYDGSDPSKLKDDEDPVGNLRIWKKKGNVQRDPNSVQLNGDYVEPGTYSAQELTKLGFSNTGRKVTLYVEGINESDAFGGTRIVAKLGFTNRTQVVEDAIRLSVVSAEVSNEGNLSADIHQGLASFVVSPFFEPKLGQLLDGKDVKFEVFKNGTLQDQETKPLSDAGSAIDFSTSSLSGDKYRIVGTFYGSKYRSEEFEVYGGNATSISLSKDKPSLKADENEVMRISIEAKDFFGNLVEDGTPVTWRVLTGSGAILDSTQVGFKGLVNAVKTETTGGNAYMYLRAPTLASTEEPLTIQVSVDGFSRTETINVVAPTLSIVGPSTVDVAIGGTAYFILATDASDGTPVHWLNNIGNTRSQTTYVSGGTSILAAELSGPWSRAGSGLVTATIGGRMTYHEYQATSSRPLRFKFDRPVLSGDVAADGIDIFSVPGLSSPIPFAPTRNEFGRTATIPFYATTHVEVEGTPFSQVGVSTSDDQFIKIFDPVTDLPITTLSIPESGSKTILIRSLGYMDRTNTPAGFRSVEFEAHYDSGMSHHVTGRLQLTEHTTWTRTLDGAYGFIGGDPAGASGVAGNIAGGVLIVGDVGSLTKNFWRGIGFSNKPVNELEVFLSGMGIVTELAVGVGEAVDVPISSVRSIVAALGKTPFTDALVILLKQALKNAQSLPRLAAFLAKITGTEIAFQISKQVFTSDDLLAAGVKAFDDLGDKFFTGLQKVGTWLNNGVSLCQTITKILSELPKEAIDALKALPESQFAEAMEFLAHAIQKGKLDEGLVLKFLTVPKGMFDKYPIYQMLKDMDSLKNVPGFASLVKSAGSVVFWAKRGRYYELRAAAYLTETTGIAPTFLGKYVPPAKTAAGKAMTSTDIDIIHQGVYYQVKRSESAFKNLSDVKKWVEKTEHYARTIDGVSAPIIKYITQDLSKIPPKVQAYLNSKNIEMIQVAGP